MKFPFFSQKQNQTTSKGDILSDFLLYASDDEKQQVFMKAAKRANKDQQDLVKRSKKLQVV